MRRPGSWRCAGAAVACLTLLATGSARADDPREDTVRHVTDHSNSRLAIGAKRWFGSALSWRSVGAARSLDRGFELTYDPYFAMVLSARLRYRPHPKLVVGVDLDLERVFTHSDWTTYAGETMLGDLRLHVAAPALVEVPVLKVRVGTGIAFTLPTSKRTRYLTLYAGVSPHLALSRRFKVLSGLTLGYRLGFTAFFHAETTSRILPEGLTRCGLNGADAAGIAGSSCLSSGRRNAQFRLINSFSLSLDFIPQFGIRVSVSTIHDFLYASLDASTFYEDANAFSPVEPDDTRYFMAYDIQLVGRPWAPLTLTLGMSTLNPQRKPASSAYYAPFFNRHTHLYLDVRLDVAKLVAAIARRPEKTP